MRQPAGLICRNCGAKLRVGQPGIIPINIVVFLLLGSLVGIIGVMERRAGIKTRGPAGVAVAALFVVCFELIRRWYTPRLVRLDVVPADHALFLPFEQDRT